MATNFVFLSVDDPELFKQGENKTFVQSHVGKYNRLKSKTYKSTVKSNRLGKLTALRVRKHEHQKVVVPEQDDQAPSIMLDGKSSSAINDGPKDDSRSYVIQKSVSPMTEIIRILPVSQQMNYGSSPTISPPSSNAHLNDLNEDEACDEEEIFNDWIAFITFRTGQGRTDPFARWPVEADESKSQISQLIDHATSGFWSLLTPHDEFGPRNPSNYIYLEHMYHSVLAFYSYTIAISHNFDFLSDLPPAAKQYRSLRAKHLHAATKSVRKYIESLPASPRPEQIPDELIGSVITLAANYRVTVYSRESRLKTKFQSPLATLQCLDMWGLLPLLPPHRLAVIQLVNLKGGLRGLRSKDLAGVVQLTDLLDASRHLSRPLLPWEDTGIALPAPVWPLEFTDESNLAKSFEMLSPSLLSFQDLGIAISAIAHTIYHLTQYFMVGCPQSAMKVLCSSRNRSQHYTLSLPKISTILFDSRPCVKQSRETLSKVERHIYEIVRLALLIFNNLVIYPLPPHTGLDTRLSRILRDEIHAAMINEPDLKDQHAELLLWALVLGGISDYHGLQRSWYVEEARDILSRMPHLRRWINMEKTLTSFLWSDFVLDTEAIKFWLEVSYVVSGRANEDSKGHH